MHYTIVTIAVMLLFGFLTGLQGANLAANRPTPWIGLYVRINIGAFLLWVAVLAFALLDVTTRRSL